MFKHRFHFKLILILAVFWLNSCGQAGGSGTGTGNPGSQSNTTPVSAITEPATKQARTALCSLIIRCTYARVTEPECESGIDSSSAFTVSIGLDPKIYPTFDAAISAETSGSITPDNDALSLCLSEIASTSCEGPSVQEVIHSSELYDKISAIVPSDPGSCPKIF